LETVVLKYSSHAALVFLYLAVKLEKLFFVFGCRRVTIMKPIPISLPPSDDPNRYYYRIL
jgi:hypothetical protein